MTEANAFAVVAIDALKWPSALQLPGKRFRLFVAADVGSTDTETLSEFAEVSLRLGMVYFCAWGDGCERFHDIVDEIVAKDEVGMRRFIGPTRHDTVMTTWHAGETLEEALDFFAIAAVPTEGFLSDSAFRLVISIGNPDWAARATQFLRSAQFS